MKQTATQIVQESWGGNAPPWVTLLAARCDQDSQASAARKLGRSASLVNQVLKNRYTGDLTAVKARVEAAFSAGGVECPVLGPIDGGVCLNHQRQPYNPGNHIAVQMFLACRRCPHRLKEKDNDNA